jgi:hypothetical protein
MKRKYKEVGAWWKMKFGWPSHSLIPRFDKIKLQPYKMGDMAKEGSKIGCMMRSSPSMAESKKKPML